MKNIVIVDGVRTPFGRLGGGLRQFHNVEMGAMVIKALLEKTNLDPKEVDAVYYGTANGDALCNNVARHAALLAGLPYESSAVGVEMQCGSAIAAINHAAYRVQNGDADVILVGGGETFSQRYAKFSCSQEPYKMLPPVAITPQLAPAKEDQLIMIQVADNMAAKWGITREECDAFALRSQMRAKAAMEGDFLDGQIAPVVIPATNLSGERNYWTTNHLLSTWRVIGYLNKEAHGIKTGSTDEAGHCLVSSAQRGSLHFVSVILGAERVEENGVGNIRSFSETTRMFNYGFDTFTYKTIIETKEYIQDAPVTLSKMDHVTVHPSEDIEVLIPKVLEPEHLERTITLQEVIEAPVQKGQKLGTLELSYDGTVYATVDLLASYDVEASKMLVFWRDTQLFFAKTSVRVACIVLVVLLIILVVWKLLGRRYYQRYGRGSIGRHGSNYRGRRRRR